MSNIIDSIQVSGTVYTLSAQTEGGGVPESAFTAYTAATDTRISTDKEVTAAALNDLNEAVSGLSESVSGKQDTLIAGDYITIDTANTISTSGLVTVADNEVAEQKTINSGNWFPSGYRPTPINGDSYSTSFDIVEDSINGGEYGQQCNYNTDIIITLIDSSGNTVSGSVGNGYITAATPSDIIPSNMTSYLDAQISIEERHGYVKYSGKNGWRIKYISDVPLGGLTTFGIYTATRIDFPGGQSARVIENTVFPELKELSQALSGKQDTLVSGTNIKTINNESILGSGNIDIQGGGGKAIEAGRGISITTGETADTVSFNLAIYDRGKTSVSECHGENSNVPICSSNFCHLEQPSGSIGSNSNSSHKEGAGSKIGNNSNNSHVEGFNCEVGTNSPFSHAEGQYTKTSNQSEHASGQYNASSRASITFGNSGNTLFSVGNGTSNSARHNAFEIRQNGDIYISLNGQDVKLQDQLGGGGSSYTPGDGIDITNDVISVTGKVDTSTYNTYTAATDTALSSKADTATTYTKTEVDTALASKQTTLTAGTNITIIDNVISATGGGGGGTVESAITSGSTNAVESKAIWSATTFNKGVLLTFNGDRESTNYPEGCTKLIVEVVGSDNMSDIEFNNDDQPLGNIEIDNLGDVINVNVRFDGASYEISGTTVIITYPTVTVTKIVALSDTSYTYTAVIEGAWVNENTYMKSEVDAIANGLQNNINSKLDATAYTPTVVDSALNVASQNPVQNQTLYSELRIANGETETTLTFEDSESTNYPNGCTKLNVEVVGSGNNSTIDFFNDNDDTLGNIEIDNWADIMVNINFDGATYEISGTTVIITYPTVTSVTKIRTSGIGNYVYKAITSLTTPLKDKVAANTTALGGLSLVKLTQAEYDALATKDNSTLYVIVN